MTTTPPGWFPDPDDASVDRYWDGSAWTEHRTPRAPSAPSSTYVPYGAPSVPGGWAPAAVAPTHGPATTSLVLGIVSLVLCGLFAGIPAMVVARRATREIDESNGRLGGRGVATAGFVTGLIGTVLSSIFLLAFLGLFVFGLAVSSSVDDSCSTVYDSGSYTTTC